MFRFAIAAACLAAMFTATDATAQQSTCMKRPAMLDHLARTRTKVPIAIGVAGTGTVVEVLLSVKGGDRKMLITSPSGISCIVAAGKGAPAASRQAPAQIPVRIQTRGTRK